jgi:hypothetical protein
VIRAYEEQMAAIESLGGKLIVMASRALARVAQSPADYERVYDRVLRQAREPVILHWLGDMFDPALAGYWGSADPGPGDGDGARRHRRARGKVDGIKISLLDKDKEIAMRRAAARRAHVHRRRLQLRRADRRRRRGRQPEPAGTATRCSASSTPSRRRPAPRWRAGRRRRSASTRSGADGAAVAPRLSRADALLQDRRRSSWRGSTATRTIRHGRRPAERAPLLHLPSCSGLADAPG